MNLLTIADGFGDSVAVPPWYPGYIKWPEIIKFMTRGVNLINVSRYGAGNEYIIHSLKNHVQQVDAVLIQWAIPVRLDLILAHKPPHADYWADQIAKDPVYFDNMVPVGADRMWLSSASKSPAVKEYHSRFVSPRQHEIRSQLYVEHATMLLQQKTHGFLLTKTSEYLDPVIHNADKWHWHKRLCGMCEFRSESDFAELDLGLTQPIPLIHFDFIKKFIKPRFDLPWRSEKDISAVENMLFRKYREALKDRPV